MSFGGIVIPKGKRSGSGEGTVVVTDRRLICHSDDGDSSYHQEMRLSDISSLSGLISKFGRSVRIPLTLIIVGLLVLVAPYMYAVGTDVADKSGDYADGYNFGVQYSYYLGYMRAVAAGTAENTIPKGYELSEPPEYPSSRYIEGYEKGLVDGAARVTSDLEASKAFSEPSDLFLYDWIVPLVEVGAVVGAILIVFGTLLYVISYRTRDWVSIRIGGAGDPGMLITSASVADAGVPVETDDTRLMITDLGAVIITIREGRTADLINSMRGDE